MILDIVKVKDTPSAGELAIKRNGRVVGGIHFQSLSGSGVWKVSFAGTELQIAEHSSKATTEMLSAYQIDTNGTFSGICYMVHEGSLFNKYDIYEMRYQSLPYNLYPIAPSDCRALPVFYGNWQVASVENDFSETGLFRNGQILAEDDKSAIVALAFFCYVRSNPQPLVSVTNKKLLGKIDRSFAERIKV